MVYLSCETLNARIHDYLIPYVEAQDFAGSVMVTRRDETIFQRAYGMANVEHEVLNRADTKFIIGSINKQFTAAAILLLEQRGLLRVEDTLGKYLPNFPNGGRIMLIHLLTHSSGLRRDVFDDPQDNKRSRSLLEWLDAFQDADLDFTPGQGHSYSNCGYVALAAVIEAASGQSYGDFLRDNIFQPCGMENSGFWDSRQVIPNLAYGYEPGFDGLTRAPIEEHADALYSTVGDLNCWLSALHRGAILRKGGLNRMLTAYPGTSYGYGITIGRRYGRRFFGHDGMVNGFYSYAVHYPDDAVSISFASNIRSGVGMMMTHHLPALIFGVDQPAPVIRRPIPVDTDVFEAYLGNYEVYPGLILNVRREKEGLSLQGTGGYHWPLMALGRHRFFYKHRYATVIFEPDETGVVDKIRWVEWSGQEFLCHRLMSMPVVA
jgi:CubicO group peptidase (beta-lactamase class C family)